MEGVECACMGRGLNGMHWEREGVYMEGVECVFMGRGRVCIWKGSSVRARGEGVCVHMEGVEFACMGRGRVCIWKGGVCVHGSLIPRPRPAFHCLQYGKAGQGLGTSVRAWGEGGCVY